VINSKSNIRWWILSLLFFATTINYLDRIAFSVLIPVIREDLHIDNDMYGLINGAFQIFYAAGFIFMGKFIDRYGTRIGYSVSVFFWSLAAALHALSSSAVNLGMWRGLLGIAESGNFPAAIKSVAEWFPKKDRAFATGIFNAGSNVASMIGPPVFIALSAAYGWRTCFYVTGGLGFVWLSIWWALYQKPADHKGLNDLERDYILSDKEVEVEGEGVGWAEALKHKQTWGFGFAKFFTDPVWWFYLYWLPVYFYDVRKFKLSEIGWALPVIYLMADLGSVGGGWLSGYFLRLGWPLAKARKVTLLIFACCMPIAAMSAMVENTIGAILLISLATAAHQGWSANLYTTTSDVFPKRAVASVTGIGGCLGGIFGFITSVATGYVVTHFGYTPVFLTMGTFHLIGWVIVHKSMGDFRRIEI
jgi:ACS family hexuronate transporter-like MFS transporter